jgi:hypothetical protein
MMPHSGMAVRVRKECREFGLLWLGALSVPLFLFFYFFNPALGDGGLLLLSTAPYYGIFALMSVVPFGREFGYATSQSLLCQPIPRWRIWIEKIVVLAVLLAIVVVAARLVGHWHWQRLARARSWQQQDRDRLWDNMVGPQAFLALACLCIGPVFSCLTRQTFTAFWLTLVAPVASMMLMVALDFGILEPLFGFTISQTLFHNKLTPLILIWCVVCAPMGWWKFTRLEV